MKILVVDDDTDLRDLTAYVLRRERFVVSEAKDAKEALRRWQQERPDLVVLDLGLPGVDGFEVLREIRAQQQTPVLVVSGRTTSQDRLRTYELGSDDFLPKPFEFRELVARIRAILRRAKGGDQEESEPPVELGGLRLVPSTAEVSWRGTRVRLTPTEFRILYLLVTNAGQVVSANRLYTYVWRGGADANALRSHISHIRRKLDAVGDPPGTITSAPAVGYAFRVAPVGRPAPGAAASAD